MSTSLQRRPGIASGRAEPGGWTTPEGSFAFVFGCDEPGRDGRFLPGDEIKIAQTDTYGAATFIRAKARLRGPGVAPPAGWRWEAFARASAGQRWAFELFPGQTRDLDDLAINTRGLGGSVALEFGLRVVGPGGSDPTVLEIPAFYLDEIVLDEVTTGLIVANRSPEPNAIGVLQSETVAFDLMDSATAPDLNATRIWIDGVLAYDGALGGAQPGYVVSLSTPDVGSRRFRVTVPYLFESLRVVPVRVVSANTGATHSVDTSWTFEVQDLTAPVVVSATSRGHMLVRVVFDEPVVGADVPSAYAFTRLEAPSVAVEAVSVVEVAVDTFDVTIDIPITRGALYRVVVSDVEDEFGNAIVAPYDRADFRGYECPPVEGRRFELWRMIAEINRQQDSTRELFKTISIFQEIVDLLLCEIDRWVEIIDVDIAEERYLDHMLIGLGNPFAFELTEGAKRRLIRTLVSVYKLKGTATGIIDVVRFFLSIEITIVAFNDGGWILGVSDLGDDTDLAPGTSRERFSFDIVSPVFLSDEQRTQIRQIAEYMKPAHTHLVRILEPVEVEVIDHLELGLSELGGDEWMLHGVAALALIVDHLGDEIVDHLGDEIVFVE
jgi:phage tail-like protein